MIFVVKLMVLVTFSYVFVGVLKAHRKFKLNSLKEGNVCQYIGELIIHD